MDRIKIIKYLYENQGKSLRKISLETGHAFETVKLYNLYPDLMILLKTYAS